MLPEAAGGVPPAARVLAAAQHLKVYDDDEAAFFGTDRSCRGQVHLASTGVDWWV